jgi:hypothetical protein
VLRKEEEMATMTPSLSRREADMRKPRLKRSMGLWMATALVIGNMVGSGIFTLPAALSGEAGPASILALAFTGIGAVLLALVFANLGRAYPKTGGPYHYARRAFGDFVGFQTAWAYWIAAWVGNAAIAVAFAGYLGVFWGNVNGKNWFAAVVAVAAVWVFTLVNIAGAREIPKASLVVATHEPVHPSVLTITPADRQLGRAVEVVVDDRAVANGWTDDAIATPLERRNELGQPVQRDHHGLPQLLTHARPILPNSRAEFDEFRALGKNPPAARGPTR